MVLPWDSPVLGLWKKPYILFMGFSLTWHEVHSTWNLYILSVTYVLSSQSSNHVILEIMGALSL